jgi:MraZ protein
MGFFYGRETSSIDDKGRCTIPSIFRKKLDPESDGRFIIVGSSRGCLKAYPYNVWEKEYSKQFAHHITLENSRKSLFNLATVATSWMYEVQLDKQGRILIPEYMRKYAQLGDTVQINGCHYFLDLWSVERFSAYEAALLKKAEENGEELPITY